MYRKIIIYVQVLFQLSWSQNASWTIWSGINKYHFSFLKSIPSTGTTAKCNHNKSFLPRNTTVSTGSFSRPWNRNSWIREAINQLTFDLLSSSSEEKRWILDDVNCIFEQLGLSKQCPKIISEVLRRWDSC